MVPFGFRIPVCELVVVAELSADCEAAKFASDRFMGLFRLSAREFDRIGHDTFRELQF